MKLKFILSCVFSVLVLFSANATAEASAEMQQKIKNSLAVLLPGIEPDSIEMTPIPGLYEVVFGPRLVYVSEDGKYLLQGNIVNLETRENLTEPRLMEAKISSVNSVGEDNMIVYSPPEGTEVKHQINVFTDIDCGYCRKLHNEMSDYNEAGIEIRYLFYPRAGKGSDSYKKAVKVWCADDRRAAMDASKSGKTVDSDTSCDNPVEDHMALGALVGVSGTPAMVLSDGQLVPGYIPAKRLARLLDARQAAK